MNRNKAGDIRRSQIISTFGPGAIVDFRSPEGAPVSVVSAGIDEWPDAPGQTIHEPRLERKLGVSCFHLPPIGEYRTGEKRHGKPVVKEYTVPSVRFPDWHFCPRCYRLQRSRKWNSSPGSSALYCGSCSSRHDRSHVVPVRFITACEKGHLGEFPWGRWVKHEESCNSGDKKLKLLRQGAGLKGLRVHCTGCGKSRNLENAFSAGMMKSLGVKCSGESPWLPLDREECDSEPRVLQRGASNTYFPVLETALDIPPWGDAFQDALGHHWHMLASIEDEKHVRMQIDLIMQHDWSGPKMSADEMFRKVMQRRKRLDRLDPRNMRHDEYFHLTSGETIGTGRDETDFKLHPEEVPASLSGLISHIVRVERLREVRALVGFTRLNEPSPDLAREDMARISAEPKNWLPAIEVRGEGIFIALDEKHLATWEKHDAVAKRTEELRSLVEKSWRERSDGDVPCPYDISARLLLVHTLSHAFMRRLSLDCGYSTAAIRERLYVSTEDEGMAGFLVYTASTDADGTLGSLCRQGRAKRVEQTLINAVRDLEWCSSDPLCSQGLSTFSDAANLAACHACVFAPETACEYFNRFLDRAMLVGLPEQPELGFFRKLMQGQES